MSLWVVLSSELPSSLIMLFVAGVLFVRVLYQTAPWRVGDVNDTRPTIRLAGFGLVLLALSVPLPLNTKLAPVARSVLHEVVRSAFVRVPLPPSDAGRTPGSNASLVRTHEAAPWRNVVVIWLESTGYDATSLGGQFDTTPVLAELSKDSLVANAAWTVVPHSTKSAVSIFCGVPPNFLMDVVESNTLPVDCLPKLLSTEGYATLMLRSATRHFEGWTGLMSNIGFEEFLAAEDLDTEGFERVNYFGYEDDVLLPAARDWLVENGDKPFFLSYMTGAPHHDYVVPNDFQMHTYVEDEEHNNYLNLVRYVDRFVGKVLDLHKELGVYEETLFVVVGDHGEAFGEHGRMQHDAVPYTEVAHVPLLVHAPGTFEGGREMHVPASHIDIVPTIADMLGYRMDAPDREGRVLNQLPTSRTVKFLCWYTRRCGAVREGNHTLVYHFDGRPSELFDVEEDPYQRADIASEHPEVVEHMERDLLQWVANGLLRYGEG